ncbi:MAG: hypothetical protein WC460_02080 [Patescibacteria group bacterium]
MVLGIVIFFIIIIDIFTVFYFHKSISNAIFDVLASLILTSFLMALVFYIIDKKEKQQTAQIEQLTEAYQYIGQINRKIDALLELDIASLDQSAHRPIHETASGIFKQLITLLGAKAGFLHLNPPLEFKIYIDQQKNSEVKNALEILARTGAKEFRHSQGAANELFFKELGLTENLLKKYDFVIKPVYMHKRDIGIMLLLFKKNQPLEDRDLNIIRVFSFYLALNATFKPDFSSSQT